MKFPDVSIVLAFRDHEHLVGQACRNIAEYFSQHKRSFEIIAVDEGSGDNSHAVIALLRQEIPTLRAVVGKGYVTGAAQAQGKTLLLLNLETAVDLSPSLNEALARVLTDDIQMLLVAEHCLLCCRKQCQVLITEGLATRQVTERGLLKRGRARGFCTESYGPESRSLSDTGVGRVISALVPRSTGLHRAW